MSRKKTPDNEAPETTIAVAEPPAPEAAPPPQTFAERVGQRKFATAPDPFAIAADTVAGLRLFESRRDRQMALRFDDKPSQPVIDKLKEAGFRWNSVHKVWAHPTTGDSGMSARIEAERLFQEVRQTVRHEKGFPASPPEVPF